MANDKRNFYTVVVQYKKTPLDTEHQLLHGVAMCSYKLQNLTTQALSIFRNNVFLEGVYIPVDSDTGYIVPPFNITHIEVFRQARFFSAAELNKPLTK